VTAPERAGDADRERAVVALREHAVATAIPVPSRLEMEQFWGQTPPTHGRPIRVGSDPGWLMAVGLSRA
jgi:hypothetical protein